MAKRYQVMKTVALSTPDNADEFVFDESVDLAVLLSQRLQKNIRQGRVFNLHKIEGQVRVVNDPLNTQELDLGVAVQGEALWCPATKNSASAWRHAFSVWNKQKKLAVNATGPFVRYDDFEVAFNTAYSDSRTSTLYASGVNDVTPEKVCIYGDSDSGDDVTLEDIYESARPQSSPSRFPLSNSVVKESKFTQEFPNTRQARFGCHWSAVNDANTSFDSGAVIGSTPAYITDGACLAGVVIVRGRMLPENTIFHIQDEMVLDITFTVSIGAPLHVKPHALKKRPRQFKSGVSAKKQGRYQRMKRRAWKRYRNRS